MLTASPWSNAARCGGRLVTSWDAVLHFWQLAKSSVGLREVCASGGEFLAVGGGRQWLSWNMVARGCVFCWDDVSIVFVSIYFLFSVNVESLVQDSESATCICVCVFGCAVDFDSDTACGRLSCPRFRSHLVGRGGSRSRGASS